MKADALATAVAAGLAELAALAPRLAPAELQAVLMVVRAMTRQQG